MRELSREGCRELSPDESKTFLDVDLEVLAEAREEGIEYDIMSFGKKAREKLCDILLRVSEERIQDKASLILFLQSYLTTEPPTSDYQAFSSGRIGKHFGLLNLFSPQDGPTDSQKRIKVKVSELQQDSTQAAEEVSELQQDLMQAAKEGLEPGDIPLRQFTGSSPI